VKGLEIIEELLELYSEYIPNQISAKIRELILNIPETHFSVQDLLPDSSSYQEREDLYKVCKQLKRMVAYIDLLLDKKEETLSKVSANEQFIELVDEYSIDVKLVDAIEGFYPNTKFSIGILFFACLVFSKNDVPVEEIVYQNLENDYIKIWTVVNNASREQRCIIYRQQKIVARVFQESLISFRVIEVNDFHNEFDHFDKSYQRIAPPSYVE
jgi:hypothetical protein